MDMITQPEKVLAACEALMPHLYNVALNSADPNHQVPIGFWMHRGCVPFISPEQFNSHYWPTLKPIIEELWKNGHQTLFYAEGDWTHHLDSFAELSERSIVFHADRSDIFKAHKVFGHKFCLSGGIPNGVLSFQTPADVRNYCKKIIDGVAKDGGYILDASAIIQNDTSIENMRIMTDFVRDYGVYSSGSSNPVETYPDIIPSSDSTFSNNYGMTRMVKRKMNAGVCIPWEEKLKEIPNISGDREIVKSIWEDIDSLGNMFIWQSLLSF